MEATVIFHDYACTPTAPAELCPQCEKRYSAILAMYGMPEHLATVAGWDVVIKQALSMLCYMAQQRKEGTPP